MRNQPAIILSIFCKEARTVAASSGGPVLIGIAPGFRTISLYLFDSEFEIVSRRGSRSAPIGTPPENQSTQAVSVLSPLVARVLGSAASSRAIALFRNRKFADSALEGGGFEPVVPLRWRSPEREVKIDGAPVVTAK